MNEYYEKGRKHDSSYEKTMAGMKESSDKASKIIYNGFIAQDVEKAATKLNFNFSGVDKPQTEDGLYGLRYADFVVPLVKAVQELSKMNDDKDAKINELETRLSKLEALMNVQSASISAASLQQNIPNPYNKSTSIAYTLPQTYSSAKIIITDNAGKVLKTINVSGSKGNVTIDAANYASGGYQYSLYLNGQLVDTKQMLLVK